MSVLFIKFASKFCGKPLASITRRSQVVYQSSRMLQLKATPIRSLMDEQVSIHVEGLSPKQPVTVAAMLQEAGDIAFVSHGHYTANQKGEVDMDTMVSSGGTFTGCEPMGLFWSLQAEMKHRNKGLRLRKKDVTQSHVMQISVLKDHITANSPRFHEPGAVLSQTTIERGYMASKVKRIQIREGRLRGTLFVPNEGVGCHPGVIDMYGSSGGLAEYRASLLASRGFTTFALAYFAYDDLPKYMELELEYFEEAVEFLSSHKNVSQGGIGTIGTSKGSEFAITMALLSQKVIAVVTVNSFNYLGSAKHSYRGKEVPAVFPDMSKMEIQEDGSILLRRSFAEADGIENCLLQVENGKQAEFLFLHGAEDQLCDPQCGAKLALRMRQHNRDNFSLHIYSGAGHLLEPPYLPTCTVNTHSLFNQNMVLGGKTKEHAYAQVDAWDKILSFYKKNLPESTLDISSKL